MVTTRERTNIKKYVWLRWIVHELLPLFLSAKSKWIAELYHLSVEALLQRIAELVVAIVAICPVALKVV